MKAASFGEWFHQQRKFAKKTQRDIADALDYESSQFVSNWEHNKSLPPMAAAPTIAQLLGVSSKEVLTVMHDQKVKELNKEFQQAKKVFK